MSLREALLEPGSTIGQLILPPVDGEGSLVEGSARFEGPQPGQGGLPLEETSGQPDRYEGAEQMQRRPYDAVQQPHAA